MTSETRTRVRTRFYISPRLLDVEGAELAGVYELGPPLEVQGDVFANAYSFGEMQKLIADRTDVVADLLSGVFLYLKGDYAAVITQLETLERSWSGTVGKETIYLFLGNAAGKLNAFDDAAEYYRRGLDVRRGYSRNLVGLAETYYHHGSGGGTCEADAVNARSLYEARDLYRRAAALQAQPQDQYAMVKTDFGEGRLLYCMSIAGLDDQWHGAEVRLRSVVASYERGEEGVVQLAAESWALLGLLKYTAEPRTASAVDDALQCLDNAIDLSTDEARTRAFQRVRRSMNDAQRVAPAAAAVDTSLTSTSTGARSRR